MVNADNRYPDIVTLSLKNPMERKRIHLAKGIKKLKCREKSVQRETWGLTHLIRKRSLS